MPDLSVVIVTYNSEGDIRGCLDSVYKTTGGLDMEVFVVDNASIDGTVEAIRQGYPNVVLIANDHNAGFPAANNQALGLAQGRYVMLLNPDTVVHPGALETIVRFMDDHPDCGICAPRLEDQNGNEAPDLRRPTFGYYLACLVGVRGLMAKHLPARKLEMVSGACMALRREVLDGVGLMDEDLFWCEDLDYCARAVAKGWRVCVAPDARVTHFVGHSAKSNLALVLEKQYSSTLGYFHKHASGPEFRRVVRLFVLEAWVRMVKWRVKAIACKSEEAQLRAKTFRRLVRDIPLYARRLSGDVSAHS